MSKTLLNLHLIDIIRVDDTTFLVTWDDTDNVGLVNLTKDELKEFTTTSGSDKGEHITSMFKKNTFFHWYFSEVRREVLMETDDLVFKLRLRFDICCMASEERRVLQQVEEDPSLLYCRSSSMCPHFRIKNWGTFI